MKHGNAIIMLISVGAILIILGMLLSQYPTTGVTRDTIVNETFYLGSESYR